MQYKLKNIMESLSSIFFIVMAVAVVLITAITILAILFINNLHKELNAYIHLNNPIKPITPIKSRPSILYMLEEGFFKIELFINEEGREVWSVGHYHGDNELYVNKQPNKPFIIGYSDDVNSRITIPDKYITKVNRCE